MLSTLLKTVKEHNQLGAVICGDDYSERNECRKLKLCLDLTSHAALTLINNHYALPIAINKKGLLNTPLKGSERTQTAWSNHYVEMTAAKEMNGARLRGLDCISTLMKGP